MFIFLLSPFHHRYQSTSLPLLLETAVAPLVFTNQGHRSTSFSLKGQNLDHVPLSEGCDVAFTVVNKVRTWALDREVFQNIMRRTAETRHEQYRNFLRRFVPSCSHEASITSLLMIPVGVNVQQIVPCIRK